MRSLIHRYPDVTLAVLGILLFGVGLALNRKNLAKFATDTALTVAYHQRIR